MNNVVNALFLILGLRRMQREEPKKRNAKSFSKAVKQSMRQEVNELIDKMK
jgi:hypothetical protein